MVCCSLMPTLNSTGNTLRGLPSLISSGKTWNTSRGNGTCTVKWSLNVGKGQRNGVQHVFRSRARWTTWYSREDEPDASLLQILLGKRYFPKRICFRGLSELWHQHAAKTCFSCKIPAAFYLFTITPTQMMLAWAAPLKIKGGWCQSEVSLTNADMQGQHSIFFLKQLLHPFFKQLLYGTSLCGFLLLSWGGVNTWKSHVKSR